MHQLATFFLFITLLFPTTTFAEPLNAGFVQGLWYSNPTPFADKPVRIYVALRNNSNQDLTGLVIFTDNDDAAGTTTIKALPGRLVEAWIDWTPSYGEHTIVATLSEVKTNAVRNNPEEVDVISTLAKNTIVVDYDTDDDGIGNEEDLDDDNDGILDDEEIARGSDPLVFNQPLRVATTTEETNLTEDINTPKETEEDFGPSSSSVSGLERYVDDGIINETLTSVTNTVTAAKVAIDSYREDRVKQLSAEDLPVIQETSSRENDTLETSSSMVATITRSDAKTEDSSFLASIGSMLKMVISKVYTFLLWLTSWLLGYPVIIQLLLLLGLLFGTYKLIKKIGSRPKY